MLSGAKSTAMSKSKQPFCVAKELQMEAKNRHFADSKHCHFTKIRTQQADYQQYNKTPLFSFKTDKGWT